MDDTDAGVAGPSSANNPLELLRTRGYIVMCVLGAAVGVPVALVAYGFLALVGKSQNWLFNTLPVDLGFDEMPWWWPIPLLLIAGVIVALAIDRLPGTGGHEPADGFHSGAPPAPIELPGIVLAAFGSLAFGAVIGPEAPLIALGGGLAVLIVHLLKRDAPAQAVLVIGAAGSFAAVSTLLGSPLLGAFLLMEAAGLAGAMMGVVMVPGLLAAGIGALIFVGLDGITGLGTYSLGIPDIPDFETPRLSQFLWAIGIGLLAACLGAVIKRGAKLLQPIVSTRRLLFTPLIGVAVALSAVVFDAITDRGSTSVLFSGQEDLPSLIHDASSWTAGALVALVACKSVAYCLSLSSFRGGPIFPSMFIGAAGGMALSHIGGLPMIAGVGMGIGAMAVSMLGLPLTSVLLAALFLQADAAALMPLIIVAVAVAYVASARLEPAPSPVAAAPPADSDG
ncbi:MAG TPA: chloride channel protein [Acidimicrobiales bacterium]